MIRSKKKKLSQLVEEKKKRLFSKEELVNFANQQFNQLLKKNLQLPVQLYNL